MHYCVYMNIAVYKYHDTRMCVCAHSLKLEAMTIGVQPLWSPFKDFEWVQRLGVKLNLPSRERFLG